jgi:hypothetical protein
MSCAQRGRVVEEADHCRLAFGGEPGQRALAGLTSSIDEDNTRVLKRLVNQRFGAAGIRPDGSCMAAVCRMS